MFDEQQEMLVFRVDDDRNQTPAARVTAFDDDHQYPALGDEYCSDGHCASEISFSLDHGHHHGDHRHDRISSVDSNRTWHKCDVHRQGKRFILSLLVSEVTVDENWPRHEWPWGEQPAEEDDEVFSEINPQGFSTTKD